MRLRSKILPLIVVHLNLFGASQTFIPQGPAPSLDTLLSPTNTEPGSIQPLAVSPSDPNTIFLGGSNGGIWRTQNRGVSWTPLTDFQASLSMQVIAFDPLDVSNQTLIAGVGINSNGSLYGPYGGGRGGQKIGILYSQNGGNSWTLPAGNTALSTQSVCGVIARGATLLAGTFEPQDFATGVGALYRSTDRGSTFSSISGSGGLDSGPITSLVGDPSNPNVLYAAVTNPTTKINTAVFRSPDLGVTWSKIFSSTNSAGLINATNQTVLKVATGPSGSVAVCVVNAVAPAGDGGVISGIFLSPSGAAPTWTQVDLTAVTAAGGFNPEGSAVVNSFVAIDPNNPTIVYALGTYNPNLSYFPLSLWRFTVTGGTTTAVALLPATDGSETHADGRTLSFDSNGQLFITSDGGAYIRTNPSGSSGVFQSINGSLGTWQAFGAGYDGNNNLIVASGQDTGNTVQNSPTSLSYTSLSITGDGVNAVVNDTGPSSYYYTTVQMVSNLNRITMTNGVQTSSVQLAFSGADPVGTMDFASDSPVVLNRINPFKIAFGGISNVYTTIDTITSSTLALTPVALPPNSGTLSLAYGTADALEALLIGAGKTKKVLFTPNVATTAPAILPSYTGQAPSVVVFDQRTMNRFFVIDGITVWGTTNTGLSFTDLSSNFSPTFSTPTSLEFISNNGVQSLLIGGVSTAASQNQLMVADSDVNGALSNWRSFGLNIPNTYVNVLSYDIKSDTLLASAWGRSLWLMYDVTSNFSTATVLQFGLANNNSTPDTSVLTGSRPLIKYGPGTLSIVGTATYTGMTTVNNGTLLLNGTIPGNAVINTGSALSGTGTIAGSVTMQSGSTLSPGNSTAVLTVGSLNISPGAVTLILVDPNNASSIVVNGPATVGGTLHLSQASGAYTPGKVYTLLTSTAITGAFTPTGALPGFSLIQTPTLIQLGYTALTTVAISLSGLTGNALTLAQYLNTNAPTSQANLLLSSLSGGTLQSALEAALPTRNSFPNFILNNLMFSFSDQLDTHFSESHFDHLSDRADVNKNTASLNSLLPPEELLSAINNKSLRKPNKKTEQEKNSIWATAFADFAHQGSQHQCPSFNFDGEGVIIGYDRRFPEKGTVGVAAGYAASHFRDHHHFGKGKIESFVIGPYGTVYFSKAYLDAELLLSLNKTHNHRYITFPGYQATASASFNTTQLMPHLELGYDLSYSFGVVEPFVRFDWVYSWQQGFKEQGSPAFDMQQKHKNSSMLRSEAGFQLYHYWKGDSLTFMLKESLSCVNKAPFHTGKGSAALIGNPSFFSVESFTSNQTLFSFGLLASIKKKNGFFGTLSYEGEFGHKYQSNNAQLKLGKFF